MTDCGKTKTNQQNQHSQLVVEKAIVMIPEQHSCGPNNRCSSCVQRLSVDSLSIGRSRPARNTQVRDSQILLDTAAATIVVADSCGCGENRTKDDSDDVLVDDLRSSARASSNVRLDRS